MPRSIVALTFALALVAASCAASKQTCDLASCAGCCDAQNNCVPGAGSALCGANGDRCVECATTQICQRGQCVAPEAPRDGGDGLDAGSGDGGARLLGDGCEDPEPWTGAESVSGATAGFHDGTRGSCGGAGTPEHVYRLNLDADFQGVQLTVLHTASSPAPTVYLRQAPCRDGFELACNTQGILSVPQLPAGVYYVFVEQPASAALGYTLSASSGVRFLFTNAGDTCETAVPLGFLGGTTSVTDNTAALSADYTDPSPTCATEGEDMVFTFTTATAGTFSAHIEAAQGSPLFPSLYLREEPCDTWSGTRDSLGCYGGASGFADFPSITLPAGTHFLVVDGSDVNTPGQFTLTVNFH